MLFNENMYGMCYHGNINLRFNALLTGRESVHSGSLRLMFNSLFAK